MPQAALLTASESWEVAIAPEFQSEMIAQIEDPLAKEQAERSRWIYLQKMKAEEERAQQSALRMATPRLSFRK